MSSDNHSRSGIGELSTVENVGGSGSESSKLIVGWVLIDGDLKRVAFTENDLKRPLSRAERNVEDIPVLSSRPDGFNVLRDEIERLNGRGFWARLFNR